MYFGDNNLISNRLFSSKVQLKVNRKIMKKSLFVTMIFSLCLLCSSCGNKADGPAEEVLSKKTYTKVVNQYDRVRDFHEGLCVVGLKDSNYDYKYGAIDTKGNVVIPIEYDDVNDCQEGVCVVKIGGWNAKCGIVDAKGNVVLAPCYHKMEDFNNGLAVVQDPQTELYGFVNKKGEVAIPLSYKYASSFSDDLALVRVKSGKYGYINNQEEIVIPTIYDDAETFSEGLAIVEKANKEMVIDKKGELIYTLPKNQSFDDGYGYQNGLILVVKDRDGNWWSDDDQKYGYLDTKGEVVIDFIYDDADDFEDGIAYVKKNDRIFLINTKGEEVE